MPALILLMVSSGSACKLVQLRMHIQHSGLYLHHRICIYSACIPTYEFANMLNTLHCSTVQCVIADLYYNKTSWR